MAIDLARMHALSLSLLFESVSENQTTGTYFHPIPFIQLDGQIFSSFRNDLPLSHA
jgi:hypothetical protein